MTRIVTGPIPPARQRDPKAGVVPPERFFTFSLRYWVEREYFGIGEADKVWFTSLLERLKDLSKEKVSRFWEDGVFKDSLRYHVINWNAKNAPLSREDFKWLPSAIRDNEAEFPIYQITISLGVGRVHGFWDANWCFNIVLLDPMHNLQPSKDLGYRVRSTAVSSCQYSELRVALDRACAMPCPNPDCQFAKTIVELNPQAVADQFVILAGVTPDVAEQLEQLRSRSAQFISMSEIVEHGITFFGEKC